MKNLFIICVLTGTNLMAQPPIPEVDDGNVISPIDGFTGIALLFALIMYFFLVYKKKKVQSSI